jgi:hypothetical protein
MHEEAEIDELLKHSDIEEFIIHQILKNSSEFVSVYTISTDVDSPAIAEVLRGGAEA